MDYSNRHLYRIVHKDNLEHILKCGKLCCNNHNEADGNYIGIGDETLIKNRDKRNITIPPFGTFKDYVSFYFCPKTPMLYKIQRGFSVQQRVKRDIIFVVTRIDKIIESNVEYIFSDGHAYAYLSKLYNQIEYLDEIDWDVILSKYWDNTEEDMDRKRKRQAELLVHNELSLDSLIGLGVFDTEAKASIEKLLQNYDIRNIEVKVKPNYYY